MNTPMKVGVAVLAAIGALAVFGVAAMAVTHFSMMGGGWAC